MTKRYRPTHVGGAMTALLLCLGTHDAMAQQPAATTAERNAARREFHIAAQPLEAALLSFGAQAGLSIGAAPALVQGRNSVAVDGSFTPQEALDRLLAGTGIVSRIDLEQRTVALSAAERRSEVTVPVPALTSVTTSVRPLAAPQPLPEEITVTGSRIRGAPVSSPVIRLSQEQMRDAGQTNLGEVARSLPQAFSGGQNPGVGAGALGEQNLNVNSASTLNLRGLGPDATLTLFNGKRLSYGSATQAVDIASLPIAAVDRLEVVADGASALYGSDAVGGVANIVLKRDYQGVSTTARFGAATDGGDEQQQYSIVGGTRWDGGGLIATYDFERDLPITARQRSYTAKLEGASTLLPYQRHHSAVVSGHQQLLDNLEFSMDALYSDRRKQNFLPFTAGASYLVSGNEQVATVETFTVSPSLKLTLPGGWTSSAYFVYGEDRTHSRSQSYANSLPSTLTTLCYCNSTSSAEVNAEGGLFQLPGGQVRLALGGGYRSNTMHLNRIGKSGATTLLSINFNVEQKSYYGYGELFVPLVSSTQGVPLVYQLSLSGAARFEDYPGMDKVATPKLGVSYAPTQDLDLKGSWGKSFKAPTLYQLYQDQFAYLYPASTFGTGFAPGATTLYLLAGNKALTPERATSWTATATLHPRNWGGAELEFSYFRINYDDRVVQPLVSSSGSLNNPIYRELIAFNPTAAQQAAAIAGAASGVTNTTAIPYNPASVVAIIDNRYRNVARQALRGFDVSARYPIDLGAAGTLTIMGAASYLTSKQQLSQGQPTVSLAGNIFNPPHFRGRAGASWERDSLTLTSYVNHIGSVTDARSNPTLRVSGQTTLDMTMRYRTDERAAMFANMELAFSIANALNDKPSIIRTNADYFTPYDSTNYSATGRFISLSITKRL